MTPAASDTHTMTRTLHVHIGSAPEERDDLRETLAALDAGEDVEAEPSRLVVESLATFNRIFRPTNLGLLEALAEHDPDSIRDLAEIVGRHPPEVTENVNELADYGLVRFEEDGRAKRPWLWYDEIEISGDVPLSGVDRGDAAAAP